MKYNVKPSECNHEHVYSETPRPDLPSLTPGTKPEKNGMLHALDRHDIAIDYCYTCESWIFEGKPFRDQGKLIEWADSDREPEDEFRWNVEIYFGKNDGTWNMDRTYIPYDGPIDEESILDPYDHVYENAKQAALREFDARDDMARVGVAFRGIYSINLEQK